MPDACIISVGSINVDFQMRTIAGPTRAKPSSARIS